MSRRRSGLSPSIVLRLSLAAALAWATGELVVRLGRAERAAPAQEDGLRRGLDRLRVPLAAEPDRARRRRVALDVLTMLDAGRREADLRSAALRGDAARRSSWPRILGPAVRDSAVDPVELGEALRLLLLSAARRIEGGSSVPDELAGRREELAGWLAGAGSP